MAQDPADLPSPHTVGSRRPVLVWVICALYVIVTVAAVPAILAATSGLLQLSSPAAQFYESFGVLDYIGVFASAILNVFAAATLFRMRRAAFACVLAAFLVALLQRVWYWPSLQAVGRGLGSEVLATVLGAVVVLYVWRLRISGRLIGREERPRQEQVE